jgi:hypothetical protein
MLRQLLIHGVHEELRYGEFMYTGVVSHRCSDIKTCVSAIFGALVTFRFAQLQAHCWCHCESQYSAHIITVVITNTVSNIMQLRRSYEHKFHLYDLVVHIKLTHHLNMQWNNIILDRSNVQQQHCNGVAAYRRWTNGINPFVSWWTIEFDVT